MAKQDRKDKLEEMFDIQPKEVSHVIAGANQWEFLLIKRKYAFLKGAVPYKSFGLAFEDKEWDGDAAVKRLREWASEDGSGEKDKMDWSKYRTAFLWADDEDLENFGSYKMPVVDIVKGVPLLVFNGVVAAYGAMQGARGGVDVPEGDREPILDRLKRYYEDFDKKFPLDKSKSFMDATDKDSKQDFLMLDSDEEERIVMGLILVPNEPDAQGDFYTEKAVRDAARKYLLASQQIDKTVSTGVMHKQATDPFLVCESYTAPVDMMVHGTSIKKGSWVVVAKITDDEVWGKVKKGEYKMFSFEGKGRGYELN